MWLVISQMCYLFSFLPLIAHNLTWLVTCSFEMVWTIQELPTLRGEPSQHSLVQVLDDHHRKMSEEQMTRRKQRKLLGTIWIWCPCVIRLEELAGFCIYRWYTCWQLSETWAAGFHMNGGQFGWLRGSPCCPTPDWELPKFGVGNARDDHMPPSSHSSY